MDNGWTRRDSSTMEAGHQSGYQAGRWLDVKQAAEELSISSDAVRKRLARGKLRSSKGDDGSVWVWLDSADDRRDDDQPTGGTEAGHRLDELVEAKEEALRDLRDQLEYMRRESERKDAIIMQMAQANASLTQRLPELAPPREEPHDPETVAETTTGTETPSGQADRESEAGVQRRERSWWRRFFGFE
jgi:hypothetical protein